MTSHTPASSDSFPSPAIGVGCLAASVYNAETLWLAFAAARNHRVVDDPAWLAVDAGDNVGGTRVILRAPVTGTAQFASLHRLIEDLSWPVVVEDPFATINLRAHNLVPRSLSVMVAEPLTPDSPPPVEQPDITVREVQGDEKRLLTADRIVVEGFPLRSYQPYQPGRMLPAGLLRMPHVSVFVAELRGTPCGACMTVTDTDGVGGLYWVAVLPEHRRAGVGRALMMAAMQELLGLPMVLCATPLGEPLYRTLGFPTALESTYWGVGNPT